MSAQPKPGNPFENDPVAQAILREGLLIQDRFSAAPIYATTGKGFLKSVGVEEIARAKEELKKREPRTPGRGWHLCHGKWSFGKTNSCAIRKWPITVRLLTDTPIAGHCGRD